MLQRLRARHAAAGPEPHRGRYNVRMVSLAIQLPALESGDRMELDEFRRRYELREDIKKAEWIGGVVYVSSPVRSPNHAIPHALLMGVLAQYRSSRPGLLLDDNATLRARGGDVQPDAMLRYGVSRQGRSSLDEDRYVVGSPELAAEVASSSASYDLHVKKDLYRENNVAEYVVWRVEDETIDRFVLEGGDYRLLEPGDDGVTRSRVFPGLQIDVAALLEQARESFRESGLIP